jgi:hypothetical protein
MSRRGRRKKSLQHVLKTRQEISVSEGYDQRGGIGAKRSANAAPALRVRWERCRAGQRNDEIERVFTTPGVVVA